MLSDVDINVDINVDNPVDVNKNEGDGLDSGLDWEHIQLCAILFLYDGK